MRKLLVVGAAAIPLVGLVFWLRAPTGSTTATVTPANAAEVATTAVAKDPVPAAPPVVSAVTAVTSVPTASAAPVDAYDPFAHREDIEAALARKDVSALPALQQIDLTRDGYVAAAAIDAVGKLAALAPEKEKRDAVRTLDKWLQQESKRKTSDAQGNVSILVDALQDTKSDASIGPLVAMLDAATQPLHIETRIVEALTALNATTSVASVAAIERFAARVRAMQPQDDFQKALVTEALAAANVALKK